LAALTDLWGYRFRSRGRPPRRRRRPRRRVTAAPRHGSRGPAAESLWFRKSAATRSLAAKAQTH